MSAGAASCGIRDWMTTRLERAAAGKSHSWLTPTTSRSKPMAKSISVAEGNRDTIRMRRDFSTKGKRKNSARASSFRNRCTAHRIRGRLLVKIILATECVEIVELARPTGDDLFRRRAFLQLANGVGVGDQKQ